MTGDLNALAGDDSDAIRVLGRRLARHGVVDVEIGKCSDPAHAFHAAASFQKGRAHVTVEGTGSSPLAAVEDLTRLVGIHAPKKRGRR